MDNSAYILGTAPNKLIYLYTNANGEVWGIQPGQEKIDPGSIIYGIHEAVRVLCEIQDNYEEIYNFGCTVFERTIGEHHINPEEIHIYKLGIVQEVI